jgi:hypothetical protein
MRMKMASPTTYVLSRQAPVIAMVSDGEVAVVALSSHPAGPTGPQVDFVFLQSAKVASSFLG